MKHSIRTRFTLGMIFLFVIISVLAVFSGYYLNTLSNKTSAILKENYLSVVYAREMTENIQKINQEITMDYLEHRSLDSSSILNGLNSVNQSLIAEKNNITEPGEDKLVSDFEKEYMQYKDTVLKIIKLPLSTSGMRYLQNKSGYLYHQLMLLSQMNGKALEAKTDDAKASSKSALTRMTILATLCFLIGMSFTFSFSSYFNRRFYQLYYGLKEIVSSNFDHRLFFDGNDEFYEISLVLNEMADKLRNNKEKLSVTLNQEYEKELLSHDLEELKKMVSRMKSIEADASALISSLERK
jgi:NtrC-family two-component system sensor histidine kinase KinB